MSWRRGKDVKLWALVEKAGVKPRYMKALSQEIRSILAEKATIVKL